MWRPYNPMDQQKRAAGSHTGRPSTTPDSSSHSFAFRDEIKQAVLNAARIEDHAERAGFRRGRYGRWHSAFREDKNPSCSIRNGYITDWARNERWNAIDLEMLATGQPFIQALRALASEYGLRMASEASNPSAARQRALGWRKSKERAFHWRAGFMDLAEDILTEEKGRLFDPLSGPANESLILSLDRAARIIREAQSTRFLLSAFEIFSEAMPSLTLALVDHGDSLRFERQSALAAFIELLADSEADR